MLGLFVPFEFVHVCVCLGLHQRELFCASGSEARRDELKKSMNGGEFQSFGSDDVHAVASLLILFLRELPKGLIPWWSAKWLLSVYTSTVTLQSISVCLHLQNSKLDQMCIDSLLYHAETKGKVLDLKRAKKVLESFAPEIFNILCLLIHFLSRVAAHSHINHMTSADLSEIFGPCIFA